MSAFIMEKLCLGCKHCVKACPVQAINMMAHLPVVDPTLCTECGDTVWNDVCMEQLLLWQQRRIRKMNKNQQDKPEAELELQLNVVEKKLAELKSRWPFHSVQPKMVSDLEDLEEERERIRGLLYPS